MSAPDRRAKLVRYHLHPSVRRQGAMLGIARCRFRRLSRPAIDDHVRQIRRIDEPIKDPPGASISGLVHSEGDFVKPKTTSP